MPPERIAEANQLLAKPPVVGLALSRALGLHVVGLARGPPRHHRRAPARRARRARRARSRCRRRCSSPEPCPRRRRPRRDPVYAPDVGADGAADAARRAPGRLAPARRAAGGAVAPRGPGRRRAAERRRAPTRSPCRPSAPPVVDPDDLRRAHRGAAARAGRPPIVEPTRGRAVRGAPAVRAPSRRRAARSSAPPPCRRRRSRRRCPDDVADAAPLPTRIPGQHLSHQPTVAGDAAGADADPMRPYRVHELLTRHTQGKQRGRAEHGRRPRIDAAPRDDRARCVRSRTGGRAMMQLSAEARNLNWLVSNFVERVPGVTGSDRRVVRRPAHRAVRRPRPQLG